MPYLSTRSAFWLCVLSFGAIFFHLFSNICFPFAVGFFLAYLAAPTLDRLSASWNRGFVSTLFSLGSVFFFILVALVIVPKIKDCVILLHRNAPTYYDNLLTFLNNTFSDLDLSPYQRDLANFKNEMQNYMNKKVYLLASVIEKIAPAGNALTHFISFFVIMPISFFYFLRDWKAMSSAIFECIPNRQRDICLEVAVVIRTSLQNFLGGQMYVALILSAYYTAALFAADLEDRVFFGILSGVASFVPCIGALFSFALVVFINATALTLTKLYMLVASYFVGQFLETYLLYPHFIGKKTKLHPLWILFSFFAGLELKGIIGVLMAIPLTAVARAVIVFAVDKFKSTQAYKQ